MKRKKSKSDRPHKKIRAVIGRPSERANVKRISFFGEKAEIITEIELRHDADKQTNTAKKRESRNT